MLVNPERAQTLDAAIAVVAALKASNLRSEFFPAALRIAEQLLDVDKIAFALDPPDDDDDADWGDTPAAKA